VIRVEFSVADMKRILKGAGASRVSKEAAIKLDEVLEMYAGYISEEAVGRAQDQGRKTVKKEDVMRAKA